MFFPSGNSRCENQGSSTALSGDIASVPPKSFGKHLNEGDTVATLMKDSKVRVPRDVEERGVSSDSVEWIQPGRCPTPPRSAIAIMAALSISTFIALLVAVETTTFRSHSQQQLPHPGIPPTTTTAGQPQVASLRPVEPPVQPPTVAATPPQPSLAKTTAPTQKYVPSPGFPVCYICGNSIRQMTKPDATILFPEQSEPKACADLEYAGLHGYIDPTYCPMLALFEVAGKCGCTGETNAPAAATVSPTTLSPSQPPSSAEASLRLNELRSLLLNLSVSNEEEFYNRSSPQFLALNWLANEDPAQLDVSKATWDAVEKRYIMAAIYFATGGETWYHPEFFLTGDEICDWHDPLNTTGVLCNPLQLRLSSNTLYGFLVGELGKLSDMRALDLSNNALAGTIPTELGQLAELTALDLGNNGFVGSIPSTLGQLSRLRHLNLGINSLSGTVPDELKMLTELTHLEIKTNTLMGAAPFELASLSNL